MFWARRGSEAAVTTSYHQWEGHLQDIYNTLDNAGTRMPTVAPVVLQVRAQDDTEVIFLTNSD